MKDSDQKIYYFGVGMLLHMMKWSRPEISNAVRELSRFMKTATLAHMKAMKNVMNYTVATTEHGLLLKPYAELDVIPEIEPEMSRQTDSDFAMNPIRRKRVSGYTTLLNGAVVLLKSKVQQCVT
jgi:hypothetical protein